MEGRCQRVDITTGGHRVVYVPRKYFEALDLHLLDRVEVINSLEPGSTSVASVQYWSDPSGNIGLCHELADELGIDETGSISFRTMDKPLSVSHIVDRMNGSELSGEQMEEIVRDIASDSLSEIENTCFITSTTIKDLTMSELFHLTRNLAESGDTFNWEDPMVADKHCTGGVPGNRTSPIVVSIISSLGVKIPKASSRAITSPAGTADVMESMCEVAFDKEKITDIVNRNNGCLIWGGGLNVAPADSRLIRIRKMIKSNPEGLLISSVLSKKYAMGSKYLLLDMPVGLETRYHSLGEVRHMAEKAKKIASKLGMKAEVEITYGDEPIGNGIGPDLETRDVLQVLMNRPEAPADLKDKAIRIAGKLIDLIGKDRFGSDHRQGDGFEIAKEKLISGDAFGKFRDIVSSQNGDPDSLDPSRFKGSSHVIEIRASSDGRLADLNNVVIAKVARLAGAPRSKDCGLDISVRSGDILSKGDLLMTIHSGSKERKDLVLDHLSMNKIYTIE